MRKWRAGSITLGLALVIFGVSMLLSRILGTFTLLDVAVWWPILPIILGCEILAALFLSDERPLRVVYDGGSIFLIALILMFTIGLSVVGFVVDLLPEGLDTVKAEIYKEISLHERVSEFKIAADGASVGPSNPDKLASDPDKLKFRYVKKPLIGNPDLRDDGQRQER